MQTAKFLRSILQVTKVRIFLLPTKFWGGLFLTKKTTFEVQMHRGCANLIYAPNLRALFLR